MRTKNFITMGGLLLIAVIAAIAAAQSPSPNTSAPASQTQPATAGQQGASSQSDYVLKVKTRVITVDVVATDSHGDVVRDLKQNDFEISDNGPQKIAQFDFVDKWANAAAATPPPTPPGAKGLYSNHPRNLTVPPTVLLMDALNTPIQTQAQVRRHMILLLKTLPPNTPVAVLLLGIRLGVVQDFTSDPALLRAALDKVTSPSVLGVENPEDDANTLSEMYLQNETTDGEEDAVSRLLEDFELEQYGQMMTVQVDMTVDALKQIADYVKGYSGRKNLIWVSSSFPIAILPQTGFGTNPFQGTQGYSEKVQEAVRALSDAQVSVYAVYAGGLETQQAYAPNQQTTIRSRRPGPGFGQQLNREDTNRSLSEGTMMELAEGTGGKTCKNTNDLSGCVAGALKDSSSYYELAYYPQDVEWNGSFHKISVKTTRHGVNLSYRRGYYAVDEEALAKQESPEKRLRETCQELLPSTAIPLAAQAAPQDKPGELRYIMGIPVSALDLGPASASRDLKMELGICQFTSKGGSFQFTPRNLTRNVTDATYQVWQKQGFREFVDVPAAVDTRRVRLAVFDERTGLTGAVDIPVRAEDIEKAGAAPAANPAALQGAGAATAPAGAQAQPYYSVGFNAKSGASSTLDWNGDKLWYHGNIGVEQTVPIFFHDMFAAKFRCEDGVLRARDESSKEQPNLQFTFQNPSGHAAVVDLSGDDPKYAGDLSVDPSAKAFFDRLWYFCQCRAAPAMTSASTPAAAPN